VSSTTAIPTTTTTATTTTSTTTTTTTLYGVDYEGSGYVDWIFNLSSRPFTVAAGTVTTASTGTLSDTRFSTVTTPSLDPYLDSRLGYIAQSTSTSYPSTGSSSVLTTVRTTSSTSKPTTSVYLTTTTKPVTTTLPFRLTSTASTRKYTTTARRFFTTVKGWIRLPNPSFWLRLWPVRTPGRQEAHSLIQRGLHRSLFQMWVALSLASTTTTLLHCLLSLLLRLSTIHPRRRSQQRLLRILTLARILTGSGFTWLTDCFTQLFNISGTTLWQVSPTRPTATTGLRRIREAFTAGQQLSHNGSRRRFWVRKS
jgi:hypothetical protein